MKGYDVRARGSVSCVPIPLPLSPLARWGGEGGEERKEDTRYSKRVSRVPLIGDRG